MQHSWSALNTAQVAPVELWRDSNIACSFLDGFQPDLGERMAHAFEAILATNEAVLLVGSDSFSWMLIT